MNRFTIDTQEELKVGIIRVLHEQLNEIVVQLNIPDNVDFSVHEIRKCFKRIRAILRIIRWDIGEEAYHVENVKFRELSRLISRARDLHVIITYLVECFEADEIPIPEQNYIEFINYLNNKKEEELKHLNDKKVFEHLVLEAKISAENIDAHYPSEMGPSTIQKGVFHVYSQCLNQMEIAQKMHDDESYHKLRKQVKYLLYQMQLCEEVWPSYFSNYSESIKEATDLLGNDHNLVETLKIIEETPDDILPELIKNQLRKSIHNERDQIHQDTWPLMAKIFTEEPDAFIKRINSYWLLGRQH